MSQQTPPPPSPAPKRKSRWLRWLMGTAVVLLLVFVGIGIALPVVASTDMVKGWVVGAIEPNVKGKVELDGLDFSWGRGITIRGLRIKNPNGFPDADAISVDRVVAAVSYSSLIRGRIKAQVEVDAPKIRIHVAKGGRINLKEIAPDGNTKSSTGKPGKKEPTEFNHRISFVQTNGLVEIIDEERGIRQEIRDIHIRLGNAAAGKPIAMTLEGKLSGTKEAGTVFASAKVDPARQMPLEFFQFKTTGIDLAAYEPIVATFLPEKRFESFRGTIQGDLSATPIDGSPEIQVVGDLEVRDLDIRGGPLTEGRGFVAKRWSLTPNARIDYDKLTGSINGLQLDIGFAKVEALPLDAARSLFAGQQLATAPLGVTVRVDLAELAKQPILPKGNWRGNLVLRAATLVPTGDATDLPFAVDLNGTGIAISGDFLPEGSKVPDSLTMTAKGRMTRGDAASVDGTATVHTSGIDGNANFAVGKTYKANGQLTAASAELMPLIAAFLPAGLKLEQQTKVTFDAHGTLPGDDASGGLIAGEHNLTADVAAPSVRYLGNVLQGLAQKVILDKGKLSMTPSGKGQLNGGPLNLGLHITDVLTDKRSIDFDVSWAGGKAGYGVTPLLQYAMPLLAGLPTDNLQTLSGIDFESTAGFSLKGGGPLPTSAKDALAMLGKWSAKGRLQLQNGSFTPSAALDGVLKLLGKTGKIAFDEITTQVTIKDGFINTKDFAMGGSDGKVTLSGKTSLSGVMNASLDFTDWLSKHRDGRKVLGALGGQKLRVDIGGTLWSPQIKMEDFLKNTLEQGVKGALDNFLKGLQKGKKPGKALEDIFKGLGGRKK